jgi:hypothetical protein
LALLILCQGLAYLMSLGSYRGGPVFPALYLGAAGIMSSQLAGYLETAGVAVGVSAEIAAVLRLPLTAVVLGTLLTTNAGKRVEPLIIVGVAVSVVVTVILARRPKNATAPAPSANGTAPGGADPSPLTAAGGRELDHPAQESNHTTLMFSRSPGSPCSSSPPPPFTLRSHMRQAAP